MDRNGQAADGDRGTDCHGLRSGASGARTHDLTDYESVALTN